MEGKRGKVNKAVKREIWGDWLKIEGFWGKYGAWGQEICKIDKKFIVIFRLADYYNISVVKINGYQTEVKVLNNGINRISELCVLEL